MDVDDDDGGVEDALVVDSGPVPTELVSQQTDSISAEGRHETSRAINAKARNSRGENLSVQMRNSFSGPLPHPALLKAYNEACPGAGDRILAMAEEEGKHRRHLEKDGQAFAMKNFAEDDRRGQWLGFCLMMVAILCGTVLVAMGFAAGAALLFGSLGTFATVAVWRRVDERKADKAERDALEKQRQEQLEARKRKEKTE